MIYFLRKCWKFQCIGKDKNFKTFRQQKYICML